MSKFYQFIIHECVEVNPTRSDKKKLKQASRDNNKYVSPFLSTYWCFKEFVVIYKLLIVLLSC